MAQSVEPPALGFGSGHDLMACEIEPHIGLCTDSEPPWDSLSASLLAPPHLCALPLKINIFLKVII